MRVYGAISDLSGIRVAGQAFGRRLARLASQERRRRRFPRKQPSRDRRNLFRGLVGLPLSYRSTASDIAGALKTAYAKALIYEAQFAEKVKPTPKETPTFCFGGEGPNQFESLIDGASKDRTTVTVDEHDPFYFNMTSGTTGKPKSYLLSHYNNFTVSSFIQALDICRRDVVLTVFPLFASGSVGRRCR